MYKEMSSRFTSVIKIKLHVRWLLLTSHAAVEHYA
jgi:hypothetical protein